MQGWLAGGYHLVLVSGWWFESNAGFLSHGGHGRSQNHPKVVRLTRKKNGFSPILRNTQVCLLSVSQMMRPIRILPDNWWITLPNKSFNWLIWFLAGWTHPKNSPHKHEAVGLYTHSGIWSYHNAWEIMMKQKQTEDNTDFQLFHWDDHQLFPQ